PYTLQQNGIAEGEWQSLMTMTRCLLTEASLPKHLWAELFNTAVYISNRIPSSALGETPSSSRQHLRILDSGHHMKVEERSHKDTHLARTQRHHLVQDQQESQEHRHACVTTIVLHRSTWSTIRKPCRPMSCYTVHCIPLGGEFSSLEQALQRPEADKWQAAMDDEHNRLLFRLG
ncbi:unnamed protein product, partial [Discosporangium mesarthrocarpum]